MAVLFMYNQVLSQPLNSYLTGRLSALIIPQ